MPNSTIIGPQRIRRAINWSVERDPVVGADPLSGHDTRPSLLAGANVIGLLVISVVGLALQTPAIAQSPPMRVGQCSMTRVKWVGTRLDNTPGSGSAIQFMNGGYQVSYDQVAAVDRSRPGDPVRMCLIFLPKDCPPGDDRGRVYKTTNLRTRRSWSLPDAEHMCGGA